MYQMRRNYIMFYFDTDEDKILAMMFGKIIKNGGLWV